MPTATPRIFSAKKWPWPSLGAGVAVLVVGLCLGSLGAVAWRAEGPGRLGAADWAAIRFTLVQAVLSALASCALAVPVARALARRRFAGRELMITLLGAPFILPVIVAVLGLLAVFGRGGLVSQGLGALGLAPLEIYGLGGVVLAHVFFNLPLATRLVLQGWAAIPSERFRLAASLGASAGDVARLLERPMLRAVLPGAALAIFLICLSSFAVALTLGGGPRASTVELAIYQAFRLEFDLGRAALLGLVQVGLALAALALSLRVALPAALEGGLDRPPPPRPEAARPALRLVDALWLVLAAGFLLVPLLMVVLRGLPGLVDMPASVWAAAGRSLIVALGATALALAMAVPLGLAISRAGRGAGLLEGAGMAPLAISPLVLGTGLFIVLLGLGPSPQALALPITAVVNAVLALPFVLRALLPALREAEANYGRLAASLGLSGLARLRLVTLPRLRRPLGFVAGLTAALSMGDLGVIALFADPAQATLPMQIYALMGAYRMDAAAGAALMLLALSLALFWVFDRGGRGSDAAA